MEITSNHIDVMGAGYAPAASDDTGEESQRRVDKFGTPVSQSELVGLFIALELTVSYKSNPWGEPYLDRQN